MDPDQPVTVSDLTREQARQWAAAQPQDDDRVVVGESPERASVVAGLRALAGYLAANPAGCRRAAQGLAGKTRL